MLSLKVVMHGGKTKTMRFTGNMSIAEACKDIREKTEEGGPDHSLFRPPNDLKHRKGQWLLGNRTFNFYDIISGEELHYRKRHRQMKISLMDGQEKMVLVDESASIRDVCAEICEKLHLEKPYEEWSLTLGSTRAFLDPVLGLQEQGVTEADRVWLKKKHFWTDNKIDKSSPINLKLMYHQARFGITHGEHFVTEEEAVMFASLQLQQELGPYDKNKHKAASVFKDVSHFFEEKYQKKKKLHQQAFKEWSENLGQMTELDAMYQYMKLARGLATYGIVMFAVGVVVPGKREKVPELVGVARDEVLRMDYKTRAILERWPYMMIKRWAATNDMFTLDFGHKREQYYNAYTNNAAGLGLQIQGYLDIMLRLRQQEGKVTEVNDATTTTIDDVAPDMGTVFEYNTTMVIIGDSDDEDMDSGEVLGSDDDDPDPVPLREKLLRPGNPGAGAGDRHDDPDNDPNPVPLPKKLLRPGKGPGGAGDKGPKKVFVSDLATCIDAVGQMQQMIEIPLNPQKVVAVDPDKPRKAFEEGMARLPRELAEPKDHAHDIAATLAGIIRAAREVAAKDDDISLLEAARRVAQETEELLKCTRDLDDDPDSVPLKKRLVVHKSALKGASTYALGAVQGLLVDPSSEQLLLATAKQLADAVNRMASVATVASEEVESQAIEELSVKMVQLGKVIPSRVQQVASVASSKADIAELGNKSLAASKRLLELCTAEQVSEEQMRRVEKAVAQVQASSAQLVDATTASKSRAHQEHENLAEALRQVGESADAILDSAGDKTALEQHSSSLADNLAQLIAAGKNLAKLDSDTISLLSAAKQVSTAVEGLLATTRDAADDTKNMALAREMLHTAQTISSEVKAALAHEDQSSLPFSVVRHEGRKVAAATAELCTKAREVLPQVDKSRQKELIEAVTSAEVATQRMVKVVASAESEQSRREVQEKMVKAVKSHAKVFQQLTTVARSCVPSIEKTAVKADLGNATEQVAERVRGLVSALQAIPDEGARAFAAVEKSLEKEGVKIDSAMLNAAVDNLTQTLPRLEAVERLQVALVDLQRCMDVMRKADTSALVAAGKSLVAAFGEVVESSVVVAAATSDGSEKQVVLQKARAMIPQISELLGAAKSEVRGVAQEDDVSFMDAAKNVSRMLRGMIGSDEAAAIKAANRRFLPDLSALLKAAKAAADGSDDDANLSLLNAAKTVSSSLKDLMATCRDGDLPVDLLSGVKKLLASVDQQLGDKGTSRVQGEATQVAVGAVNDSVTDLLEAARNYEEGPEDCLLVAKQIGRMLRALEKAPSQPQKASLDQLVGFAEAVAMAANRTVDVASKVPKVARAHPAELGPHVNAILPAVQALIDASNNMARVLPDGVAAAEAVERVRTICDTLASLSSSSRTAKCDSGADGQMNISLVELRRAVRDLVALSEKATPGLQVLDESARTIGDAARFGVALDVDAPFAGLGGLEAASGILEEALKTTISVASSDPASLGEAASEVAKAAVEVVTAAQNYDAIARSVAIVQRADLLAQKMRDASTSEESTSLAKELAGLVAGLVNSMKEVSQGERSTDVKNAIKAAYSDVKPAQQDLIEAAKGSKREGGLSAAADAADHLALVLRGMVFATPDARGAEELLAAAKAVATQTKHAVQNAMGVAKRPGDGFVKGQLLMAVNDVSQSRADLITTARSMAAGRAELEAARKRVAKQVGEMETSGIAAEIGLLNVATAKTRTEAQEALVGSANEMSASVSALLEVAKLKDMREMGALASPIADAVDGTALTSRQLAGTTGDEGFQILSLSTAKEVGQAALDFLDAALLLSADPNSKSAQQGLVKARSAAAANVARLNEALQTSAEGLARCGEASSQILEHKTLLQSPPDEAQPYVVAQTTVVAAARGVGKAVQKVQRGARGNAPEIGTYCLELASKMETFAAAVAMASLSVTELSLRDRLLSEAERTLDETSSLCVVARAIASDPRSEKHLTELSIVFKSCTSALGGAVTAIRDAAVGDKACRELGVAISKMQAELDTAAIFCESGHFQHGSMGENADLGEITASFEASAKGCLSKSKALVKAMSSQSELADSAKAMASALEKLAEDAKVVASAIGDFVEFSVQKGVLVDTKGNLLAAQAVVIAASQSRDTEEMTSLVRVLGQSLVSLVKSVKEAAGTAIETQEAVSRAREVMVSMRDGYSALRARTDNAREVSDALAVVSQAAGRVIAASSKNSLLLALDEATAAMGEFLKKARGAESLSKGKDVGLGKTACAVADCFLELLDAVSQRKKKDDWDTQEAVAGFSDTMADRIADVISALKLLPGQKEIDLEENGLGDEVVDALNVAIKAVSAETAKLRSPEGANKGDIGPLLVAATSAIITATKGMLKASFATQEELVARGKANARLNVFSRDPNWARGLMATVEEVVRFNSFLVSVTNRTAATDMSSISQAIEELSKAARNLNQGSSKLVASAKAKSESSSASSQRLTKAGQKVTEAITALIEAGKHAADIARQNSMKVDREPYDFDKRTQQGELKAQLEIATLERELERAKTAAKVKSDLADSWSQSTTKAPSLIDKKMAARKAAKKEQEVDLNAKLRKDVAEAKKQAQKKIAKVATRTSQAQDEKTKKIAKEESRRSGRFGEEDSDDAGDLPVLPRPDEEDSGDQELPPPVSDDDE